MTLALYITDFVAQFPSIGHCAGFLQMHFFLLVVSLDWFPSLALCLAMWSFMFGIVQYDNLRLFLLKIFPILDVAGKCVWTISKKSFPILVLTLIQNGGLKYIMFLLLLRLFLLVFGVLMYWIGVEYPLSARALLYGVTSSWNIFSLLELLEILCAIIDGI